MTHFSSPDDIMQFLRTTGRYNKLLQRIANTADKKSFLFELYFAAWCESHGTALDYEVGFNPENNTTVDFSFHTETGYTCCFDLVRPELSEPIQQDIYRQQDRSGPVHIYRVSLSSDHKNPHFRTAAQLIRLQEKLLEKTEKFPRSSQAFFAILIVDCSNIHLGRINDEDCRQVMYGRARDPNLQELWDGQPIKGLLDAGHPGRAAEEFQRRVSAVIFVPRLSAALLKSAFVTLNELRTREHLVAFCEYIGKLDAFSRIEFVNPVL